MAIKFCCQGDQRIRIFGLEFFRGIFLRRRRKDVEEAAAKANVKINKIEVECMLILFPNKILQKKT